MSVGNHRNLGRLVGLLCLALGISTVCRVQDVLEGASDEGYQL